MKISVDFDGTLTEMPVRRFCLRMMALGHEVWVCTMRYDDAHLAKAKRYVGYDNARLYEVCDLLNIARKHIIFCNETIKSPFLEPHNFAFHLDDDRYVMQEIESALPGLCVDVTRHDWEERCMQALEDAAA